MISSARRKFWIDGNLPPALARMLSTMPDTDAEHFFDLDFHATPDREAFFLARQQGATLVSKDVDFVNLVEQHGSPPQVVWVRSGNARTSVLLDLFRTHMSQLRKHLDDGIPLIALEP